MQYMYASWFINPGSIPSELGALSFLSLIGLYNNQLEGVYIWMSMYGVLCIMIICIAAIVPGIHCVYSYFVYIVVNKIVLLLRAIFFCHKVQFLLN